MAMLTIIVDCHIKNCDFPITFLYVYQAVYLSESTLSDYDYGSP